MDTSVTHNDVGHAMLDGILQPMMAVDAVRRIALRNRRARELLRMGSLMREYAGCRLHACTAENDTLLGMALGELTSGTRERWSIRLRHGDHQVSVQLRRLARVPAPLASITIFEPAAASARADTLAEAFGLTPAEIRVASYLAEGLTPKEIAAACGVSTCTVRSQLSTLFEKTGARRQPDLVRLVLLAWTF